MAKRYQPHELLGEQGGVQTFAGRDVVNGLPVRVYSFVGEPTLKEGELRSDFIPPILSSSFTGLAGEVVSAFSDEFKKLKGAVAPGQVEALLHETAAALDDAAKAGIVHGDLTPERVFFDREGGAGGRFLLEGYGVPWPVRPSEFSAPERIGGASFAADIFSWARTVKHLSGPLPGDLRDLLDGCLSADPSTRPHAREVRSALTRYTFGGTAPKPNPQAHRDTSAFESYAENYEDADAGEGLGENSGLTLPPKIFKLKEYQRQTAAQPAEQPSIQPSPQPPSQPSVSVQPLETPPKSAPPPAGRVRLVSGAAKPHAKPQRSSDSLRLVDATEAYRERLAAYQAKHGTQPSRVQSNDHSDSDNPAPPTAAPRVLPDTPPTPAAHPEPAPAAEAAPRVRVQPLQDSGDALYVDKPLRARRAEPDESDFEVIDDIDDRAPDPTLYRGGRRVLLLTLLGIALLVLLTLQFINA